MQERDMRKIWLVEAEHFSVPSRWLKACSSEATANVFARQTAIEIAKDYHSPVEMAKLTDDVSIDDILSAVQDEHGSAHCYVQITELDVL
jgi:hypothetical protein